MAVAVGTLTHAAAAQVTRAAGCLLATTAMATTGVGKRGKSSSYILSPNLKQQRQLGILKSPGYQRRYEATFVHRKRNYSFHDWNCTYAYLTDSLIGMLLLHRMMPFESTICAKLGLQQKYIFEANIKC